MTVVKTVPGMATYFHVTYKSANGAIFIVHYVTIYVISVIFIKHQNILKLWANSAFFMSYVLLVISSVNTM